MGGNLSINAAVLNTTATEELPPSEMGYFCSTSQGGSAGHGGDVPAGVLRMQCQSVPPGTPGASSKAACEAECYDGPATSFECTRCAHIFQVDRDGHGVAFADLAEEWRCPVCGAP